MSDAVTQINTFDDLIGFGSLVRASLSPRPWFRGHALKDWKLIPAAFRDLFESDAISYENSQVKKFRARARLRHTGCPDDADHFRWLSLMRHYGLATRLLDWTESLLVAAYFAADPQHEGEVGRIYALDPSIFGPKSGVYCEHDDPVLCAAADAFNGNIHPSARPLTVFPSESSLRMLVQQSTFTIHRSTCDMRFGGGARLLVAEFGLQCKKEIQTACHALGVADGWVYPDLEWMARHLVKSELVGFGTVS